MKPYNRDEPMIVLFMRYLNGKNCTGAKNRSQRTKATMETVPTTSMEITVPDAQPLDCPLARENGRRMRENAAVQRRRLRTSRRTRRIKAKKMTPEQKKQKNQKKRPDMPSVVKRSTKNIRGSSTGSNRMQRIRTH